MSRPSQTTLEQRLAAGVVIGAEGYVFELERRGYVKAGPYVPEVILDAPDALRQLHREFLRAGSDVMVALTYYAHREKLKDATAYDIARFDPARFQKGGGDESSIAQDAAATSR